MAKQRPTGKCKLCGEERLLCDSHYLPKGLYKTAGASATGLKNPNPVMNINGVLKQISDQYRGYVLCESCETLFTKQGESWVLANLPKQYGDPCALQDALAPLTPTSSGQRWERYNVLQVHEFDIQKLIYFGMSIFWRSAVHDWKTSAGQKAPLVDLGAYEEPVRNFLLGNAPFADDVVLAIDIWPYKDVLPLLHPVVNEQLPQVTVDVAKVDHAWQPIRSTTLDLTVVVPKLNALRASQDGSTKIQVSRFGPQLSI